MDVSSSMSEADPSGGSRIGGAKDAVIDFVETLPADARVGLSAYPDDGGCGAGRSVIPIGNVDRTSMSARIRTLTPEGDTPTGAALQRAGDQLLASGSGPYAIVLVSDGESNCEGVSDPPCEVARQLGAQGIDVTINTVGFQIGELGRQELQCIADATAGQYIDAGDGEELADAITTYSVPALELEVLGHPGTVALQPGSSNEVVIRATVENTGAIPAPNVQATLTFDAGFSPGSAQPRHRLGNLAPGDVTEVAWSIRPSDDFVDQTIKYTARAHTRGFTTPEHKGEIRFVWEDDPTDVNGFGAGGTLVVMGDSYSSGEGAAEGFDLGADPDDRDADPPHPDAAGRGPADEVGLDPVGRVYTTESDRGGANRNRCHRAPRHSWGAHVAVGRDMTLGLIACSGAKTEDFWSPSTTHHRPSGEAQPSQLEQLEDLRRAPTAVALTIGGNDIGFAGLGTLCLLVDNCVGAATAFVAPQLASLPSKLIRTYRETMSAAWERAGRLTPLFVLAYPQPFPGFWSSCRALVSASFTRAERYFLNQVVELLNRTIAGQVDALRRGGWPIAFVDSTASALQPDHTVCSDDEWMNYVTLAEESNLSGSIPDVVAQSVKHSFHPNHLGYAAMGRSFSAWLSAHGSPDIASDPPTLASRRPEPGRTVDLAEGGAATASLGSSFWAEAEGFAPGSTVAISVASNPEATSLAVADGSGTITAAIWLRPDLPIGSHHLVAEGYDAAGEPKVVRRSLVVRRPIPWGWWLALALTAASGIGAMSSWVGLSVRRRRRRGRRSRQRLTDATLDPSGGGGPPVTWGGNT